MFHTSIFQTYFTFVFKTVKKVEATPTHILYWLFDLDQRPPSGNRCSSKYHCWGSGGEGGGRGLAVQVLPGSLLEM